MTYVWPAPGNFWMKAPKRGRCFVCKARFKVGEQVWCYGHSRKRRRPGKFYGSSCGCGAKEQAEWDEHHERMRKEYEIEDV